MMLDLVRQQLHRKPFRPFRVVTASGARYEVSDPDRVAVREPQVFLFVSPRRRMVELRENEIEVVYEPRSSRPITARGIRPANYEGKKEHG